VFQIRQTEVFSSWLAGLRDVKGKARILARLDAVRLGRLGDTSNLGVGLHEMRVHFGPGYRVYFARQGKVVLLLLCGGDKSTQSRDITRARRLLKDIESE
jgi:putative addiction module killer protein